MNKNSFILLFIVLISYQVINKQQPSQYEQYLNKIAQQINQMNTSWTANENISLWKNGEKKDFDKLNGSFLWGQDELEEISLSMEQANDVSNDIPEEFDSRQAWNKCESIKEIRDQANCGSCWSFAAAEAFSDRWCIASNQKDQTRMSTQNLLTCCDMCGNGCGGGWDNMAWSYIQNTGLVSGNLYDQNQYCQSYTFAPCDHHVEGPLGPCPPVIQTPECSFQCAKESKISYGNDLHFSKSSGYIRLNVKAIQTEIMTNGPVEASFSVYDDFYTYKSGVYVHKTGDLSGGHAIKILGWGVEDGTPYWLCANSWNYSWGDNGFFKIKRGNNECGIESQITFGQPNVNRK